MTENYQERIRNEFQVGLCIEVGAGVVERFLNRGIVTRIEGWTSMAGTGYSDLKLSVDSKLKIKGNIGVNVWQMGFPLLGAQYLEVGLSYVNGKSGEIALDDFHIDMDLSRRAKFALYLSRILGRDFDVESQIKGLFSSPNALFEEQINKYAKNYGFKVKSFGIEIIDKGLRFNSLAEFLGESK